ncbi:MAG: ABC transporter ATP-binding protein [Pseudomonadota bacterium]|nr:ABC transporter ATP-binding protein [Pseudomonadota bacterium]
MADGPGAGITDEVRDWRGTKRLETSTKPAAATGSEHALAIRDLRVAYGPCVVLDKLTLPPIQPGHVVGVLGPNGAGKSTLLRALARLQAAQGNVTWNGINLLTCPRRTHLNTVSYLPQTLPQASSLLVYEAIESALRSTGGAVHPGMAERRISEIFDQLRIRPLAMRPLQQLSGGQRQMVGLGQVLVRQTPLLLLDEPTSALDLRWQLLALQTVRQRARQAGATAMIAMHDLNLAHRFCDHLVLLGSQGLVAAGPPREVMRPSFLLDAYQVHAKIETTPTHERVIVIERISDD